MPVGMEILGANQAPNPACQKSMRPGSSVVEFLNGEQEAVGLTIPIHVHCALNLNRNPNTFPFLRRSGKNGALVGGFAKLFPALA